MNVGLPLPRSWSHKAESRPRLEKEQEAKMSLLWLECWSSLEGFRVLLAAMAASAVGVKGGLSLLREKALPR